MGPEGKDGGSSRREQWVLKERVVVGPERKSSGS